MRSARSMGRIIVCLLLLFSISSPLSGFAEEKPKNFEQLVQKTAKQCRDEVVRRFENLVRFGKLTDAQLFDTFYIPIPNTYPQKYHTQYDKVLDGALQSLLDSYLRRNSRFVFVVVTDANGYLPTHNSKFSQPLTGNKEVDAKKNRTKLIFDDRTGLAAARNTDDYLLQQYLRDTGETMYDLSVPIFIRGRHWGCVRIGYK